MERQHSHMSSDEYYMHSGHHYITHTFMSGPSMNILTYFPYIRSPLTNILRAYCDIRSVFFIISRAFVDMYSARFTMCCQNFVICGSFSYRLARRSRTKF